MAANKIVVCPVIVDVVAQLANRREQPLLEREAGMIGADRNPHASG
jgi:hypothetical protein